MKKAYALLIIVAILLIPAGSAFAQTYAFSLDREVVHVIWESDGTLTLAYEFTFTNATYASPLDYVDVGFPTGDYSIRNVSASINGTPINDISDSPYVTYGVALGLGSNAIQPGQIGIVRMQVSEIGNVLYIDSTDDNYASAVFSPTWFGSEYVLGSTDLTVVYHLPPSVGPDEPRYHRSPSGWQEAPATAFDEQGRITYTWRNTNASASAQYLFGASFPASYVPVNSIARPSLFQRLGIDPEALLGMGMFCIFGFFFFGIPILAVIGGNRRKLQYLPPKIAIEGHGIKRGLTAIESAVLLEQPMDKIFTMILFAVIKKGAATVTKKDPLTLDITKPQPEGLRSYETDFLNAMSESTPARRRVEMRNTMINLVKSLTRKMKGFSHKETSKYYKDIIERAWKQVEDAGTPEVLSETYDKVMEWTMLDEDYNDRTRDVFQNRPVIIPTWWHRYDPVHSAPSAPGKPSAPTSTTTPGGSGLPHLPGADFAASVVTGAQNFAGNVLGNVNSFTGEVTQKTNPVPVSTSSGSRSSGGSSCACACACAGCACACAGGGR